MVVDWPCIEQFGLLASTLILTFGVQNLWLVFTQLCTPDDIKQV